MQIIKLRKLSLKSKLNFGKYKNCTVEQMIGLRKELSLISAYYKLSSISFNEEVLSMLGVTERFKINKPGTDIATYYDFLNENGYTMRKRVNNNLTKMARKPSTYTKASLKGINQGKTW